MGSRVGDLVDLVRGNTYKSKLLGEEGPALLGLGTIARNGGFNGSKLKHYPGETSEAILMHPGDLYVSLKDITNKGDLLGAVSRVPASVPLGRLTQDTVALRFKENVGLEYQSYLYWSLRSPQYRSYCKARGMGTTNLSLSRSDFLAWELPDYDSSRKEFVQTLEDIEALTDNLTRTNGYLEVIGQQIFENRLGLCDTADAYNGTLADIAEGNPKRTLKKGSVAKYVDMGNLSTRGPYPNGWIEKSFNGGMRFINGDTLIARITPCLENGKTAYVNFLDDQEVAFGSTEYIVLTGKGGTPNEVLYFLARNRDFIGYMVGHMNGSSGRQRVSVTDALAYPIRKPAADAMAEVGQQLASIMNSIRANSEQVKVLANLRDSLLPKLMSGEIDVSEVKLPTPPNSHLHG